MSKKFLLIAAIFTLFISNISFAQDMEAKVLEIVKPLLDGKKNMSIAVGVYDVNSETPRMFFYGKISKEDTGKPDEYTVYEIGSITKTFTTTMLVMLERDGKLKINDPVQNYLPAGVTVHNFVSTMPMKLLHLATQTSGLPRLPGNLMTGEIQIREIRTKNTVKLSFTILLTITFPNTNRDRNIYIQIWEWDCLAI